MSTFATCKIFLLKTFVIRNFLGPMDATTNDFWTMIVEQGCGICVMLTNLEENGKTKCIKYWPEAGQPKTFGKFTVRLVKEKSYSGE